MRKWFEPLPFVRTVDDCRVLNRAVRILRPAPSKPTHSELVHIAMAYRRGMSAADVLEAVDKE